MGIELMFEAGLNYFTDKNTEDALYQQINIANFLTIDRDLKSYEYDDLFNLISFKKRSRVIQYRFFKDAQRAILSEIIIRLLIHKVLNIPNDKIHFNANIYGKPFLENYDEFHFNISHTDHYVVCVLGKSPVGIDIEAILPIDLRIMNRFFSNEETQFVLGHPNKERLVAFYNIWTMKESYVKYIGKGLSIPFNTFNIQNKADDIILHRLHFLENVICHVCTQSIKKPIINQLSVNSLLRDVYYG